MIPSSDTLSSFPLSPVQTGMLFQSLWRPRAGFYVQQWHVQFLRTVDRELVRHAWNHLAKRHDSLRACFAFVDQENPRQRIADTAEVPFQFEDWSGIGPTAQKRRFDAYMREDRMRAFALDEAPLMRIALFQCGPDAFRMVWTSHHLLFDGRSRYTLLREFAAIYQALEAGRLPDLPPAPAFRDFLRWMAGEDFSKARDYWRTALTGVADPTPIGLGAAVETHTGSETRRRHVTRFPSPFLGQLERFSKQNGFTLNTLFQAAWAVVLSRYTGQADVVFGAPRAGRNCPVPGVATMVGVFVNTLPVRVQVNDTVPLLDFLRGIRENWVAMRPFEQTPLREIHGWCQLPEGQPLFDSLVGFENYQMAERLTADEPWWAGTSMALDGWTNFALTIQAYRGSGIELILTYDPARFTAAAIRRLGGHLRTVLGGFLSPSVMTVGDLPLLAVAERRQVVKDWNATATAYPSAQDVVSIFSQVARASPAATALVLNDLRLSYGELDAASNAVAAWLQARGVGPSARVGVLLERSFEQVEAILGILKAGAAYVPLDSEYPLERLRFMIDDASLGLVLGDEENRGVLDGLATSFETVVRARDEGREAAGWHRLPANPDAPAYVIYTSGSTGTPKGVVVPHRGILRLVFGVDYVNLGPDRTVLQVAQLSFDASTFELWSALLHGARCVLFPFRQPQIRELARQIETHRVDTLLLITAVFNFLIDEAPEILRPVRQLLIGGEALSPAHVAKALTNLPETQLINAYGPTEGTVIACCHPIPRDGFNAAEPVPIGRPIGNTTVYVLDRRMRPVPVGAEGELFIGGAGVALGYLNRPELTTERFVPDPFSTNSASRLYRTGDLVCWRENGLIEFRGRVDDQIKIRGFRIEPGEITRVLQDHPAVKQAAVLAVETSGGKELAAFYTTGSGGDVPVAGLRSFLSERLPSYMIPVRFSAVERMPITINGKVDRAALLNAAPERPERKPDQTEPTTTLGRELAGLWSEILGVKGISVDDSFFSVGGNSLLAIRLIHRIHQKFEVEIPLHAFFEGPTIARLENWLRQRESPTDEPSIRTFRRENRGERWLLGQDRAGGVKFTFEPKNLRRRSVVRTFRLTGNLDRDALVGSIQWVARRHEALSTHYIVEAEQVFQVRSTGECPVEIRDLTGMPENQNGEEVRRILHEEETRAFDPDAEWMHRYLILVLGPYEHVMILSFHHANFDGISLNTFYRELAAHYRALTTGEVIDLPALAPQQTDVHDWLKRWLNPERTARSRAFWRATLDGVPSLELPLTADHERPSDESCRIERLAVDAAIVEGLNHRARDHGVTLFQLLLAGLNVVINRVGRNNDIAIGTSVDMRTHGTLSDAIGCLVNRVTIRIKLDDDPKVSEVVSRVASQTNEALVHRYLPIDEIPDVCGSNNILDKIGTVRFSHTAEQVGLSSLADVTCSEIPRGHHHSLGILSIGMSEKCGRVELRASHMPRILPTESLRSMLGLYDYIITTMASGLDPHLSELPRLGEPLFLRGSPDATGPRSDLERKILQAFREVLGKPEAGSLDSFFELGGHSLLAATFLHRAEQSLGRSIPLHFLFAHPTARALAEFLATSSEPHPEPSIETFRREHRGDRWLLGPARAGAVKSAFQPENLRRRSIVRTFRLTGNLGRDALAGAIQWVARRHEALSTRYIVEAGGVFQVRSAGECPVEIRDLTSLPEDQRGPEVRRILHEEETRSFDPSAEWMHRYQVLVVAPHDHVLILSFHHANFDGTSLNTFYRELTARYRASATGEAIDLPTIVPQQTDVHDWLDRWLDPERIARSRAFWRTVLEGAPLAELPVVGPEERHRNDVGRIEYLMVESATVERLNGQARNRGVTLYQLFLAGFTALISRVGRNDDVLVAINVGLRTHRSLDDVIGRFAQRLMVRTSLKSDPCFSEVVSRVASRMQEALAHRYLPFGDARKMCDAEAGLKNPLDRLFFFKSPEQDNLLSLPDVACSGIPREHHQPLGTLEVTMRKIAGRVELRATHIPAILSTETLHSMLGLFDYIMKVIASGRDPHLSELPRLGETLALRQPAAGNGARAAAERKILEIFREVLKKPDAGPTDSFFDLGGHSLVAIKLLHRVEKSIGANVPLHVLHVRPTARRLAESLETPMASDDGPTPAALVRRAGIKRERVNIYTEREIRSLQNPSTEIRNITRAFILRGRVDAGLLRRAMQWVINRHEAMRTRLVEGKPGEFWREVAPVEVNLTFTELAGGPAAGRTLELDQLIAAESNQLFKVDSFPFHVFKLLRVSSEEHVLILTFHHVFFDGRSLPVFFRDLSTAYSAFSRCEELDLPPPAFQFGDVVRWIDDGLARGALRRLREYWEKQLRGVSVLRLPCDLTAEREGERLGTMVHRSVGKDLSRRATKTAQKLGTTHFGFNHGVTTALVHSFGNLANPDVGIVCCIRTHPEAQEVIGNFNNPIIVRTDVSGNPSFGELARRIRAATREALQYRLFPYSMMLDLLPPVEKRRENPLQQVRLSEEPFFRGEFSLPGIAIEPVPRRSYTLPAMIGIQITDGQSDLIVRCSARPEYFSVQRSEQMLDQYELFLRLASDEPDRRLHDFPAFDA